MSAADADSLILASWKRLHILDKLSFSANTKFTPEQRVDVACKLLAQTQWSVNEELLSSAAAASFYEEYLHKASRYVDATAEEGGLNNYADEALSLCGVGRNESDQWRSTLSKEDVMGMACVQKYFASAKIARKREPHPHRENKITFDLDDSSSVPNYASNMCGKQLYDSSRTSPKISAIAAVNDKEYSIDALHSSSTKACSTAHYEPLFNPVPKRAAFEQAPSMPPYRHAPNTALPQAPVWRGQESLKRAREDGNDEQEEQKVMAFKTARDQLRLDEQRKFGRQRNVDAHQASYGTSKKSLGARRAGALFNKFVPPVASSGEDGQLGGRAHSVPPSGACDRNDEEPIDDRLKNIDPKMVELIQNEIMDHGAPVTWDDIAGLEFAKKTIKEIVIWPMLRPDIFTGLRGPPKGLLLFGPPGTGKTLIGKCIACQSKSTFFSISASSLTSKWVGEAEKMVRALFAVARVHEPAVIFIDEIDSLLSQRSDSEHESSRRIKTEFLVQLDGAATTNEERILVVGATNRPHELDEAARRRFVKRLYIPLPESAARRAIVLNLLTEQRHDLTHTHVDDVCQRTDGYSGADMANLCREAALGPIRSMAFADIENIAADEVRGISLLDFSHALNQVRASVSQKDLELYTDWNQQYGSWEL